MFRTQQSWFAAAVAIVIAVALVIGGCVACSQSVTASASTHPCCDPKGHCKPDPSPRQCVSPDDVALTDSPGQQILLQTELREWAGPAGPPFAAPGRESAVVDTSPQTDTPHQLSTQLRI